LEQVQRARRVSDDNNSSFGKFFEELVRAMNQIIVTKENRQHIHAARESFVDRQGRKENISDVAVQKLCYGVGWFSHFNNEINVISSTCIKRFFTSAFGAIDMG
jgi:hypothetical protein